MRSVKKLKLLLKQKPKDYYRAMDRATKIRFSSIEVSSKILCGVPPLTQGLEHNPRFKSLSPALKEKALAIVDEECSKQFEWAPKELPRLGKVIERRLKAECV